MTGANDRPGENKFNEQVIEKGFKELAKLYEHDYQQTMPELRPGAGFADELEIERIGRLVGVVIKSPVANAKAIDPAYSNTASHFGYDFDLSKLKSSEFASSEHGKIYAALLDQTKLMIDAGEPSDIPPSTIERIYTLSPDERAAEFALELAYEGQTFRRVLRVIRFVTCKPAIRTASVGVAAATVGTPASAAAVASFLATHISWITLYPPAAVAAVVGLIIVLGVEGFCTWSGNYLKNYTKSQDQITGSPGDHGYRQSGKLVLKCQALVSR